MEVIVKCSVYIFGCILGTFANILALISISTDKSSKYPGTVFLLALTACDLFICLVTLPIQTFATVLHNAPFTNPYFCVITALIFMVCESFVINCVFLIAADRYVNVLHNNFYKTHVSKKRICV